VAHGTVFQHYPTRDDMIDATIQTVGQRFTDRLHALAIGKNGLRAALTCHLECIGEMEATYARIVADAPNLPMGAYQHWLGVQSAISLHISQSAAGDVAAGKVRSMPLHLLFNTWVGLVHHYLANRTVFAPRGSVVAKCGPELLAHFLSLVTTSNSERSS
jgi:AcrR family transcriptional regulator